MQTIERIWRGRPMDVGNRIRAAEASGELIEAELLDARPGRAVVRVVLDDPTRVVAPVPRAEPVPPVVQPRVTVMRPTQRRHWARRPWLVAVAVVLALAVIVGLGVALILAVTWVVAHVAQILGVAVVVVVIVLLAGTAGGGRHCPGC